MNLYKVVIFVVSLLVAVTSSEVFAGTAPYWRFAPDIYGFMPGNTIQLTAVLCNDLSATEELNASSVANGAGVTWLPGQNLYQAGFVIEFADIAKQLNSVVLPPGACASFVWGTVSAWKDIVDGRYSIDYASINGHNSPTSIGADNVFTIFVPQVPKPLPSGVLHLLLR